MSPTNQPPTAKAIAAEQLTAKQQLELTLWVLGISATLVWGGALAATILGLSPSDGWRTFLGAFPVCGLLYFMMLLMPRWYGNSGR
jgi:hypothetical protein